MNVDAFPLLSSAAVAVIGGVSGAIAAHVCYWIQKKRGTEMFRKEKLLEQAMKVKRIQRFRYFDRPESWELEEELDMLKSAFSVYIASLGFFKRKYRNRLRAIFAEFESIRPVFRYEDGKPIPTPKLYSQQRIDVLRRLIAALI